MDSLFRTPSAISRQENAPINKSSINTSRRGNSSVKNDNLFKCQMCNRKILKHEEFTMFNFPPYNFHESCAKCTFCMKQIDSELFFEDEAIFCAQCYTDLFASPCSCCEKFIISGNKITFLDQNFHSDCFKCKNCSKDLVDEEDKTIFQGELFCIPCEKEVLNHMKKFVCDLCHLQVNTNPLTYVDQDGKKLRVHPHHLRCRLCDSKLDSFGTVDRDAAFCVQCARNDKSKICNRCGKPLIHRIINFAGKIYHNDCFKCCKCDAQLNNEPMSHKGDPYCSACHVLYAKRRCSGCTMDDCPPPYTGFSTKTWNIHHKYCNYCSKKIKDNKKGYMSIDLNLACSRCFNKYRPSHHIADNRNVNRMQTLHSVTRRHKK